MANGAVTAVQFDPDTGLEERARAFISRFRTLLRCTWFPTMRAQTLSPKLASNNGSPHRHPSWFDRE